MPCWLGPPFWNPVGAKGVYEKFTNFAYDFWHSEKVLIFTQSFWYTIPKLFAILTPQTKPRRLRPGKPPRSVHTPMEDFNHEKVDEEHFEYPSASAGWGPARYRQGPLLCLHQRHHHSGAVSRSWAPYRARYCRGVRPVSFRKTLMKWLWEQNARIFPMSE